MKKYRVFIDIMDSDGNVIQVDDRYIEATSAQEAHNIADSEYIERYETYYVWEVLESDDNI